RGAVPLPAGQGPDDGGVAVADPGHLDQGGDDEAGGGGREGRRGDVQADGEVVGVDDQLDQPGDEVLVEGEDHVAVDPDPAARRFGVEAGPGACPGGGPVPREIPGGSAGGLPAPLGGRPRGGGGEGGGGGRA